MYYSVFSPEELPQFFLKIMDELLANLDLLVTDKDGKVLFVTQSIVERTDLKPEQILGQISAELVERHEFTHSATAIALATQKPLNTVARSKYGTLFYCLSTLIYDQSHNIEFAMTQGMTIANLIQIINSLLLYSQDIPELHEIRDKLNEYNNQLVFRSPKMYETVEIADKIANADSNVLITGESGAGKDVIANYIHQKGPRKREVFLPVCIPAIPPSLLESELFGYVGGSFTNAAKSGKRGLFESANNGTIFLDEIGDFPLGLQAKLLRVIETQEIYRVGSTAPIHLNLRILAATNQDLPKMVAEGRFRRDLYHRLNTLSIKVAPLRERKEDIRVLADFFLNQYNQKHFTQKSFSSDAYNAVRLYAWPGNVRELKNLVQKAAILSSSDIIDAKQLEILFPELNIDQIIPDTGSAVIVPEHDVSQPEKIQESVAYALRSRERERIVTALLNNNGNKVAAAKELNYSRATLYRKIRELDLNDMA